PLLLRLRSLTHTPKLILKHLPVLIRDTAAGTAEVVAGMAEVAAVGTAEEVADGMVEAASGT
ncbi:hypothetical protein IW136_002495, partial [Coemansia sp. RSA 678]